MSNKLIIASAGAGKTTFLVNKALANKNKKILITTYTEANEAEIIKKIITLNKSIPQNLTVQTWFAFLLKHWVRPYQGAIYVKKINGMILVNSMSAVKFRTNKGIPICYKESEIENHYFSKNQKIYSDKISKFGLKCCKQSNGVLLKRLERIYDCIFIDEVQDLAGNDLEIIKLMLKSNIRVTMVGDPRQVTYLTHLEAKYKKYRNGRIAEFLQNECKKIQFTIDYKTLATSYRCNSSICNYASKLYPNFRIMQSSQSTSTNHDGIYLVSSKDVDKYLNEFNPVQLRISSTKKTNPNYDVYNFGASKGLSFNRVLIYPTKKIIQWIKDHEYNLTDTTRAKFYVALTRARYSVGIICDENIASLKKY